ncbi:hypothetical protein [Gordonia liuliyuniae]|uniref:Uncharacterized protein n=1 Tax=Gordonia liuliyuniae TaxID=2911517 RepID=A0ABS9IS68_9ACTN|nr:hypothetical protein [Gordonia liuliyuniae]MCF8588392.1 hypothetical protein [Gordonia liuliyuniae]
MANCALVGLTVTAYVLQLVGAALVVREVAKSHRISKQLDSIFAKVDNALRSDLDDLDEIALKSADGIESLAPFMKPLIETRMLAAHVNNVGRVLRAYVAESWPKRRWTWYVGPSCLLAGLLIGGVTSVWPLVGG